MSPTTSAGGIEAAAAGSLPYITVLGSLNMDLVSYVSHHPEPGETMTSNAFAVSPGGKGANQAVACAKLSRNRIAPTSTSEDTTTKDDPSATAHVAMVGAVGEDGYGAALRSNMAGHGVDVSGVRVLAGEKTGVAIIIVDEPTGQNRIVLSPGANFAWGEGETDLFPPQTQLLIMQREVPQPLVVRALDAARAAGVPVLLNPAPAPETEAERAALEAAFAVKAGGGPAQKGLAHLVLNETETAALVPGLTVADLDDEAGLARAAAYFLGLGVENIVMTLGGRGVYYASQSSPVGQLLPPEKVDKVVDTTGAGDTFVGQYALEVVYAAAAATTAGGQTTAFDCAAAVRKSNKAAAKTVQRKGAQDSIPWRDEIA